VTGYPLRLDVSGRRAVVVGGGAVAGRRVRGLLDAGAAVEVVAPYAVEDIAAAAADGRLVWHRRDYEPGDLAGAWVAHTATGEAAVDDAVAAEAERERVWLVRADDAARSAAWTPAVSRTDDVEVAVTAGGDPRRARAVASAVAALLDTGELPTRRQRRPSGGPGRVHLVGGGPGDAGLITTRGRRLLADADVVVVDRLAPRSLLAELDPEVEVIDVGKAPEHHAVPQEEINRLLVEHARAGKVVVRLKGGDPYVLGRGGEEVAACRAAGVAVEVVPGVTSAFAVPAAAGIPVTHRGLARGVTVVTGHDDLDWATLAALEGTLVLLMGVSRIERIVSALVGHGRDATTPVAVVESGWTPDQRTTVGTLATIAALARRRGVQAPAVIVVGDVAALADDDAYPSPPPPLLPPLPSAPPAPLRVDHGQMAVGT
jgi:uroporphyrin-III C-methyltransferase/precorrin-2 dehydrogenase/sirohydrochlorin ferrochelatase